MASDKEIFTSFEVTRPSFNLKANLGLIGTSFIDICLDTSKKCSKILYVIFLIII